MVSVDELLVGLGRAASRRRRALASVAVAAAARTAATGFAAASPRRPLGPFHRHSARRRRWGRWYIVRGQNGSEREGGWVGGGGWRKEDNRQEEREKKPCQVALKMEKTGGLRIVTIAIAPVAIATTSAALVAPTRAARVLHTYSAADQPHTAGEGGERENVNVVPRQPMVWTAPGAPEYFPMKMLTT